MYPLIVWSIKGLVSFSSWGCWPYTFPLSESQNNSSLPECPSASIGMPYSKVRVVGESRENP